MVLATPQIVALDSSTLGIVCKDYWSSVETERQKARVFVKDLSDRGVFVALTLTHMYELLRHENEMVARERLLFLAHLPLIAWLRPYDRNWFTGGTIDLFIRELRAFCFSDAQTWSEIIKEVRSDLWETGIGTDLFVDNNLIWKYIRAASIRQHANDKYIASVARTHVGDVANQTIEEARAMATRPRDERIAYMQIFARKMYSHLQQHGDKRLDGAAQIAAEFSKGMLRQVRSIDSVGGDSIDALIAHFNVPKEAVGPKTTVAELGELAIYAKNLKLLSEKLRPVSRVTMMEVPFGTLPAYTLHRKLAESQNQADRINASDLGDGHLATLVLYADRVQVDKRTYHHLETLKWKNPKLGELMCPFFKVSDYSKIPDDC